MPYDNSRSPTDRIRRYIAENFLYTRPGYPLGDNDALFTERIIDSFGVMELIAFIEDEFAITVEDSEVTEEHLGSVRAIGKLVTAKLAATPGASPSSDGQLDRADRPVESLQGPAA